MHPVEPIGGGHGSVTNPRREQPATLWTWWTTQARCPHAHSDNNKRRQPFEIGSKSPTRLHEETKIIARTAAPPPVTSSRGASRPGNVPNRAERSLADRPARHFRPSGRAHASDEVSDRCRS